MSFNDRDTEIRLVTNTGNRLLEFLIIWRTAVELLQNVDEQLFRASSFRIMMSNLTASTAAENSSLGIDNVFKGANQHFPIKKQQ